MKNKKFLLILITSFFCTLVILFSINFGMSLILSPNTVLQKISVKDVSQNIIATGRVHSQQEAVLHFQTGGKLIYLPFKEGDTVYSGQTIAQLDSTMLQQELTASLNSYRSTRDVFDQTKDNSQNNILFGQQRFNIENLTKSGTTTGDVENNIISDMAKRIIDENQASLDNSVINVQLATDALSLATLTAPFDGVILKEDVSSPNVNITSVTGFEIADPNQKIFRAQINASDIDFVDLGAKVLIHMDGQNDEITGNVIKIFPNKQILPNGQQVYLVDIQTDSLNNFLLGQNGSVVITSNANTKSYLVPSWIVLGHTNLWVWDGKNVLLKKVETGKNHNDMTEILSGLNEKDVVLTMPKNIAEKIYSLL